MSADKLLHSALAHHQAGRLPQAEALYRQVLQVAPNHPDALHLLGVIFFLQGKIDSAVDLIGRAIGVEPAMGNYHFSLGNALQAKGRLDGAVTSYRQAIRLKPDFAEAHGNMGNALQAQGRLDEAADHYRQALSIRPDLAEVRSNLGNVLQMQGRQDEAAACHRQALSIRPGFAEAHNNLGNVLKAQGQLDEASICYRQALSIKPDYAEAHNNLGNTLQIQGRLDEAIACYRQALSIKPDYAEAHNNLGNAFQAQDRLDEAIGCYRQALTRNPAYAEAYGNLGNVCKAQGRLDEAVAHHRQALLLKPDDAELHGNLGNAFQAQGRLDEAIASYRRALSLKPDYADAHSSLIFTLDLTVGMDIATLQAERLRWGAAYSATSAVPPAFPNLAEPERRLRIGYVSADLRQHSAAMGFGAMLTRFDPEMFEVFAYSNSSKEDGYTRQFQQSVTGWRNIVGLSDVAVADLIRQDGIDMLVDLSGHSGSNRLRVFARKPAPVQITAWGYAGGTGMKEMDAIFSDPVIVPPEEARYYAEEVRYLPSVISAHFPNPFPVVNPLPAMAAGRVTFGSLNRLVKMSAEAFNVWVRVLLAIPSSRLVIKAPELEFEDTRARIVGQFVRAGVNPERLSLLGRTSWQDHVDTFNQIDISLDPFPQSGGVTTLEGLMMGVPVVTLRGNTFVGRGSASILTTLGMTDWIAETPQQYVEIAVRKAQELTALAELRQQLRPRFMSSCIGDTAAYVKVVEQEYRKLWREWCASSETKGSGTHFA